MGELIDQEPGPEAQLNAGMRALQDTNSLLVKLILKGDFSDADANCEHLGVIASRLRLIVAAVATNRRIKV